MGSLCTSLIRLRAYCLACFTFFVLILNSDQMRLLAEAGRANPQPSAMSVKGDEEKAILRARIGSSPPECERTCTWCRHCEAIQVPTSPQVKNGHTTNSSSIVFGQVAYARGEDNSNYKPMSWKCKCGKFIFDP